VDALVKFGKVEGCNSRPVADLAVMMGVIQAVPFYDSECFVRG
jgi:hypothetical protein